MDGQMRLCLKVEHQGYFVVKSDIPGYSRPSYLTIFDFAIIFHPQNYLLGVIIFSTTSHV